MTSSIAAIHVAKNQLGLDEDTYRAKLRRITGKASAKEMTEDERQRVLSDFRKEGFRPVSKTRNGRRSLSGPFASKLQALWIGAWNLGIVADRKDAALEAFVTRQTGLSAERFLRFSVDARKVVEAIKAMMTREAGIQWDKAPVEWLSADGARIAWAQWKILHPGADLVSRKGFDEFALGTAGRKDWLAAMSPQDWIKVMNELGKRIRAAKKKAVAA